jgi:hypothetical protein
MRHFERVVSDTKPDIKSIQDTVSELNRRKKVTDLKDGLKEKWTERLQNISSENSINRM